MKARRKQSELSEGVEAQLDQQTSTAVARLQTIVAGELAGFHIADMGPAAARKWRDNVATIYRGLGWHAAVYHADLHAAQFILDQADRYREPTVDRALQIVTDAKQERTEWP